MYRCTNRSIHGWHSVRGCNVPRCPRLETAGHQFAGAGKKVLVGRPPLLPRAGPPTLPGVFRRARGGGFGLFFWVALNER